MVLVPPEAANLHFESTQICTGGEWDQQAMLEFWDPSWLPKWLFWVLVANECHIGCFTDACFSLAPLPAHFHNLCHTPLFFPTVLPHKTNIGWRGNKDARL